MSLLLRVFVSERLERQAREHARSARGGHAHEPVSEPMRLAERGDKEHERQGDAGEGLRGLSM